METVCKITYFGEMESAGGGCEAADSARTRCRLVMLREFGEMLYGRRLPLRLKGAVHKSYVRSAIPYGSEAWSLKESEMGILHRMERSMVRSICGHKDRNHRSVGYGKQCSFVWS